jgi:DNA-binding NarL/FixJ family response regulator
MDAIRRDQIIRAYERHARRFDELSSGRHHSTGLFPGHQTATCSEARAPVAPHEAPAASRREPGLLSRRQHEVLSLIAAGFSNNEIGTKLDIDVETVKSHVQRVLRELGARNRAHAVSLSYPHGTL